MTNIKVRLTQKCYRLANQESLKSKGRISKHLGLVSKHFGPASKHFRPVVEQNTQLTQVCSNDPGAELAVVALEERHRLGPLPQPADLGAPLGVRRNAVPGGVLEDGRKDSISLRFLLVFEAFAEYFLPVFLVTYSAAVATLTPAVF